MDSLVSAVFSDHLRDFFCSNHVSAKRFSVNVNTITFLLKKTSVMFLWWQQTLFQYSQLFPMMCFPWEGGVLERAWGLMGTLSLTSLQNVYKVPSHMIRQLTLWLATCGETVCVSHGKRKIIRFSSNLLKTGVTSGDLEREQIINTHFIV